MLLSAIYNTTTVAPPSYSAGINGGATKMVAPARLSSRGGMMIECSSRPQKKATKHHMKTRPRKSQGWDIRRGPTVYPPLPPLPPDWTLVTDGSTAAASSSTSSGSAPPPAESE
ncbi:50S ribosomal 6, chloroplastic [Olea europaea subsp. europaea]|uniref:50S ribosomal 6, chloroplastic n=1 Tax=Olea europaea subsp. europaea TaxID=158383 RepID=A0A8S0STL9_OLEEU|nr:50S ribosomal 6, chloroplastic [Olea europaea subsp. europaea]